LMMVPSDAFSSISISMMTPKMIYSLQSIGITRCDA
jgi:hypothetical protein